MRQLNLYWNNLQKMLRFLGFPVLNFQNSRFKWQKIDWNKNLKTPIWFKRRNENFWNFWVYDFAHGNLANLSFTLNIDSSCK